MDSAGARSVMSDDMKELTKGKEDISAAVRGHKANLSNPSNATSFSVMESALMIVKTHLRSRRRPADRPSRRWVEMLLTMETRTSQARMLRRSWRAAVLQNKRWYNSGAISNEVHDIVSEEQMSSPERRHCKTPTHQAI